MVIKNSSKGDVICSDAKICKSILSKTVGLMFSKKPKPLIFILKKEKIVPLHMFFVFFPIDVLFLGKNRTVVEIKENFGPFSYYRPKNKAMYVIELPAGTIKKTKTEVGDKIKISDI